MTTTPSSVPIRTVRVQSDGTPQDTVITLDDGKVLDKVMSATVYLDAKQPPTVDLEMCMPVVDVHALPDVFHFVCPCCGHGMSHECANPDS